MHFDRTTTDLFIYCPFLSFLISFGYPLAFLGATASHSLPNSAAPNAVLNSLNSSMSPLQTPSPSNPTPSPSLWPSSLTSTQGLYIVLPVALMVNLYLIYLFFYSQIMCLDACLTWKSKILTNVSIFILIFGNSGNVLHDKKPCNIFLITLIFWKLKASRLSWCCILPLRPPWAASCCPVCQVIHRTHHLLHLASPP